MSFLVILHVSISKTEKSMSKIVLNMLLLPNESCPDIPILSSGELYLSFILCQEKLSFKGNFCSYAGIFLLFMFFLFPYGNLSECECTVYWCMNGSPSYSCCLRSGCYWELLHRMDTEGNGNFLLMSEIKDGSSAHILFST